VISASLDLVSTSSTGEGFDTALARLLNRRGFARPAGFDTALRAYSTSDR